MGEPSVGLRSTRERCHSYLLAWGAIIMTITVAGKNFSQLLSRELLKPKARREDAACVAQAIAQLMDPEWREFVDQEQRAGLASAHRRDVTRY